MPTKRPETMMMMSESTPLKYTSRITRRKRWKLVPEEASTSPKKRAMEPSRQMPFTTLRPRGASALRRRSSTRAPHRESHVLAVRLGGIVEGNRAVDLTVHELAHIRQARAGNLLRWFPAPDDAGGDEVEASQQ